MKVHWQLERKTQLWIYLDGEKWRTGDTAILGKKPDLPATSNCLNELEDVYTSLEYKGARNYVYRKLASRSFSSFELLTLLTNKFVSDLNCQKIIDELTQQGYLNDDEWAEAFIKSQTRKKNGPKAILRKLQSKGYNHPDSLLKDVSQPEIQKEAILKLLSSRYRSRDFSDHYERGKVVAALLRKGYDLDVILQSIFSLS